MLFDGLIHVTMSQVIVLTVMSPSPAVPTSAARVVGVIGIAPRTVVARCESLRIWRRKSCQAVCEPAVVVDCDSFDARIMARRPPPAAALRAVADGGPSTCAGRANRRTWLLSSSDEAADVHEPDASPSSSSCSLSVLKRGRRRWCTAALADSLFFCKFRRSEHDQNSPELP